MTPSRKDWPFLLIAAIAAIVLIGCALSVATGNAAEVGSKVAAVATPKTLDLDIDLSAQFMGASVEPGKTWFRHAGQMLRFDRAAALFSGFVLERDTGEFVEISTKAFFWEAGTNSHIVLHDVPAGRYQAIGFDLGLPAALNHADPNGYAADDALNPQRNRLHWSWSGEYIFLSLEGRTRNSLGDTTNAGGFELHLAGDDQLTHFRLPLAWDLRANTTRTIAARLVFDLSKPIAHVAPHGFAPGANTTHSRPGDTIAAALADGLARAFSAGADLHTEVQDARAMVASNAAVGAIPAGTTAWAVSWPTQFPRPSLPLDNPLTEQGVALGERLFNDKALSPNQRQACASCHQAQAAFTDPQRKFSLGAQGQSGVRNTMPLFNLAWSPSYAWDGKHTRLRDQALAPFAHPLELNWPVEQAAARLANVASYQRDFAIAFGSPGVSAERIGLALEQYLLTRVSSDAKFDRVLRGDMQFTAQEKRGFELFATEYDPLHGQHGADCFHCHGGALFSAFDYRNNGLDRAAKDSGRAGISGNPFDEAKFKTPSLRNVALTAPYMHDGRFATLAEVIEHYASGVAPSPTLDSNLAKHPQLKLDLSKADKAALVAFLNTLTEIDLQPATRTSSAATRHAQATSADRSTSINR